MKNNYFTWNNIAKVLSYVTLTGVSAVSTSSIFGLPMIESTFLTGGSFAAVYVAADPIKTRAKQAFISYMERRIDPNSGIVTAKEKENLQKELDALFRREESFLPQLESDPGQENRALHNNPQKEDRTQSYTLKRK